MQLVLRIVRIIRFLFIYLEISNSRPSRVYPLFPGSTKLSVISLIYMLSFFSLSLLILIFPISLFSPVEISIHRKQRHKTYRRIYYTAVLLKKNPFRVIHYSIRGSVTSMAFNLNVSNIVLSLLIVISWDLCAWIFFLCLQLLGFLFLI